MSQLFSNPFLNEIVEHGKAFNEHFFFKFIYFARNLYFFFKKQNVRFRPIVNQLVELVFLLTRRQALMKIKIQDEGKRAECVLTCAPVCATRNSGTFVVWSIFHIFFRDT
jgi:hypothetical protein